MNLNKLIDFFEKPWSDYALMWILGTIAVLTFIWLLKGGGT